MLCEKCGKNEATYYYHENVNGKTKTFRLCGDCAKKMEEADELPSLRMDRFFDDFDSIFDELNESVIAFILNDVVSVRAAKYNCVRLEVDDTTNDIMMR